tara:strand:+ start:95 stop:319 length:225 start_codon:yes stop_codon:yes gene_type:complete
MYKCSGRTNGLYTGLWQEFCLNEAGPYCVNMWFEQQEAIKQYKQQMALKQAAPAPEPLACDDKCQEVFIDGFHD